MHQRITDQINTVSDAYGYRRAEIRSLENKGIQRTAQKHDGPRAAAFARALSGSTEGEAWTANGAVGTWSAYPSRRSRQRATHRFSRRASHHDLRPSRPTKRVMQRGIEMECTEDRSRSSLCVPDPLVDECLIVFDARLVDVSRVFLPVFLEHGRRDPFENSF